MVGSWSLKNDTRNVTQCWQLREEQRLLPHSFQRGSYINSHLLKRLGLEAELKGHNGCVNCLQWNERGTLLASGSDDHRVILWDPFQKRIVKNIDTGHTNNIFSVQFVPSTSDAVVLSGAGDCRIRMHDLNRPSGEHCIQIYACHYARVKRLAVTPVCPQLFWSAGEDGIVMQFDTRVAPNCERGECSHALVNLNAHCGPEAEIKCIAINPCRPELLAVGSTDPFVRVFDRRMLSPKRIAANSIHGERSFFERGFQQPVVSFNVEGECYDLPSNSRYFCPGHLHKKHEDFKRRYRPLAATHVTFSPCGNELLVNLGGEQIYLFDVNSRYRPTLLAQLSDLLDKMPATQSEKATQCNGFHSNGYTTNGVNAQTHGLMLMESQQTKPKRPLCLRAEELKSQANGEFEEQRFSIAVALYSQAIHIQPDAPVLYANRAAAYLKRNWDGDVYAALRDCHTTLELEPGHVKALFRLARCLHDLDMHQQALSCLNIFKVKFSSHANSSACSELEKQINNSIFKAQPAKPSKQSDKKMSETKKKKSRRKRRSEDASAPLDKEECEVAECSNDSSSSPANQQSPDTVQLSQQEIDLRTVAQDYTRRLCGHCNTTTDIKEANYFGCDGEYIVAGSDDGSFFVWERSSCNIVSVMRGDESIVNCLQPHPSSCLLATSGIEPLVKLWSPMPESGEPNSHLVTDVDRTASNNQRRMNADPFEVMLYNIGYRLGPDTAEQSDWNVPAVQCRQS